MRVSICADSRGEVAGVQGPEAAAPAGTGYVANKPAEGSA